VAFAIGKGSSAMTRLDSRSSPAVPSRIDSGVTFASWPSGM
jgi:hypothetical protein